MSFAKPIFVTLVCRRLAAMVRQLSGMVSALALLLLMPGIALSQMEAGNEAAVKVAFLYNFFKFIDWPQNVGDTDEFRLCFSSPDAFGETLTALQGKSVNDKPLSIVRSISPKELKTCHMLFISADDNPASYLRQLKNLQVVSVSDQAGFVDKGGILGLVRDGNRLAFEINLDAAQTQGLHISAQLLKLAKTVADSP